MKAKLGRNLILILSLLFAMAEAGVAQSELLELEVLFEERMSQLHEPSDNLTAQYRAALLAEGKRLQDAGKLEAYLATQEEIKRLDLEKAPATKRSEFDEVASKQEMYSQKWDEIMAVQKPKRFEAVEIYRASLEQLKASLTAEGDIDGAIRVAEAIKELDANKSFQQVTLESDLVLYLPFDEDDSNEVQDRSESGHGTKLVGDAKVRASPGSRGRYLFVDGNGDYLELPHHESFVLDGDFSLSVWARPDRLENLRGIISKYTPSHSWSLRNWKDASRSKLSFGDYDEGMRSNGELREGNWTHIVVTLEGSKLSFYLDGVLDIEGAREKPLKQNRDPVRLGSDYDGRYFTGGIDDVRVYRRALASDEVEKLHLLESQ